MSISYSKNEINVLLLENIHQSAASLFDKEGYRVELLSRSMGAEKLEEKIKNVSVLGIRSNTQVKEKILRSASNLLAIGAFCTGTDQIQLNGCLKKGVAVFNAPYSNTRSVAELAVGEIIMLMRNIFDKSAKLHQGIWDKSTSNSFEVRGKKLGIIGYGNVGSQLSILAESLGIKVYYYDVTEKLAIGNAKKCRSLSELLSQVDIVTVHVDGRPENKNLIGEKEFQKMKEGAIFLNLSRGSVVDVKALMGYISSGKIRGAGVDVYPAEPKSNSEEFISELRSLPNVILTPHIGGSTEEAQKSIGEFVASQLIDFINNGNSISSINFPNIQLPVYQNAHRFIHIHENVPGVLSQINGILAGKNINIVGQYLKTNEDIGYVITDVERKYEKQLIEEVHDDLMKVSTTIKVRVLY